jgi:hypothetical protein
MKKKLTIVITFAAALFLFFPARSNAQSIVQCLQQLALDYQKLSGLKKILSQMYMGYAILSKGYGEVQAISQGSFNLHQAFLDALLIASPTVRAYPRVEDIINQQTEMINEYNTAWTAFRQDKHFNPDEVGYMLDTYNNLISQGLKSLSDLAMILSDNKLRMSDAERLAYIDRIFQTSSGQLTYLRRFNDHNFRIAVARADVANDRRTLQTLYGFN